MNDAEMAQAEAERRAGWSAEADAQPEFAPEVIRELRDATMRLMHLIRDHGESYGLTLLEEYEGDSEAEVLGNDQALFWTAGSRDADGLPSETPGGSMMVYTREMPTPGAFIDIQLRLP